MLSLSEYKPLFIRRPAFHYGLRWKYYKSALKQATFQMVWELSVWIAQKKA